jgi:type I restriction enzyme M protein
MTSGDSNTIQNHAAFIWSVADLLRGDYKQSEYGKVILPLTVLRRLDCVLEPTKQAVLDRAAQLAGRVHNLDPILQKEAGEQFYNTSRFDFATLIAAPDDLADNLKHYVASFSASARDVLDKFDFTTQIDRLDRSKLLYLVMSKFAEIDLHPDKVSNLEMGYLYEELIRKFSELSNETAGEHFTPREVIRLMVNLLFIEDTDLLTKPGIVKTIYDGACGTGGMLSVAEDRLRELNPAASLQVYGQELNAETYAICRSDMMLKGQDATNIAYGNSFSEDGHPGLKVDYSIQNPPFGVEWKKVADAVKDEHNDRGLAGRFGAGLPRINDGSFLFLQNAISKMKPVAEGGSRVAIVFNGSPLFTGAAGSGESEIRRWIIENDWLEAVVALPDQLFYNTGISTYFWIVTNRKSPERRGKVQLVDARNCFVKMRKSLGEKRKQVSDAQIADIVRAYGDFNEVDGGDANRQRPQAQRQGLPQRGVRLPAHHRRAAAPPPLGGDRRGRRGAAGRQEVRQAHRRRPELDHRRPGPQHRHPRHRQGATRPGPHRTQAGRREGQAHRERHRRRVRHPRPRRRPGDRHQGQRPARPRPARQRERPAPRLSVTYEADVDARLGTIEYRSAIDDYMTAEVHPYVPDAWVDHDKTKIGYEIPLTRHFYTYTPPRPLDEIDAEIKQLEAEIQDLLAEVTE